MGRSTARGDVGARHVRGLASAALGVALVGLLAGCGLTPAPLGTSTPPPPRATSQPTTTLAPIPMSSTGTLPAGWSVPPSLASMTISAGPIFAATNPAVGYLCVDLHDGSLLEQTTNGGQTWSDLVPNLCGNIGLAQNILSIDPTNPDDVLLASTTTDTSGTTVNVYRSTDGGRTWIRVNLGNTTGIRVDMIAWAGPTALIVEVPAQMGSTQPAALFASAGGGAFTRLDSNGTINGVAITAQMIAGGNASEIMLGTLGTTSLLVSRTGGKTWTSTRWTYQHQSVTPVSLAPNAQTILGQDGSGLVVSVDGGQSWQPLPSEPNQGGGSSTLPIQPDGTLYLQSDADQTLYTTRPGASTWSPVLILPLGTHVVAMTWDAQGHATSLWVLDQLSPGAQSNQLLYRSLP